MKQSLVGHKQNEREEINWANWTVRLLGEPASLMSRKARVTTGTVSFELCKPTLWPAIGQSKLQANWMIIAIKISNSSSHSEHIVCLPTLVVWWHCWWHCQCHTGTFSMNNFFNFFERTNFIRIITAVHRALSSFKVLRWATVSCGELR